MNANQKPTASAEQAPNTSRRLETIRIERRFGGFLPVLQFIDGSLENAGVHVHQTAELALEKAQDWIKQPAHNISWWIGGDR